MARLTEALLGFETDRESIDSPITVTTDSSRLIDSNPNRLFLTLSNPSTNDVFIDVESDVAVRLYLEGRHTVIRRHKEALADGGPAELVIKGEQAIGVPEVN